MDVFSHELGPGEALNIRNEDDILILTLTKGGVYAGSMRGETLDITITRKAAVLDNQADNVVIEVDFKKGRRRG